MDKFLDRCDAGKRLAILLKSYAEQPNAIVLALPRGGVPVADEIAKALALPLDIFIVRKLGVPGYEELALGAIATGGDVVFNDDVIRDLNISQDTIDQVIAAEQKELQRRELTYRGDRPFPELAGKTIILVDDGIATGATMRAAIQALRQEKPKKIIIAMPVAPPDIAEEMAVLADEMFCLLQPRFFNAVGAWYKNFPQTTDEEVFELLKQ
jgi:putative phosphoribosyl transferase